MAAFARSWWGRVLLVTVVALGVRVAYVAEYRRCDPLGAAVAGTTCQGPKLSGDASYYHNAANLLADGKGFIDPYRYLVGGRDVVDVTLADGTVTSREVVTPVGHEEPTAGHPPVFVVLLGVASWVGLRSVLAHQLVGAVLGTLAVPLLALAGRRLAGDRAGLVAAGIAALYAMLWVNDGLVMSETAVVVVVPLIILAGLRFGRAPTYRHAVLFGAMGALGALTRAELALFLPIVAAVTLLRAPLPWLRRVGTYAVCGITAVVCVSPWVARNMTAFANPVYLSNGAGTVMVQTNCDPVYYGRDIGYWNLGCGAPMPYGPNGELLDESQRDVVVRHRAQDYIADHRTRLLTAVIPARIGRMFSVVQPLRQLDLEVLSEDRPKWISAVGLAQYAVLVLLGAYGVRELVRRRRPVLPVVVWLGLVAFTAGFAFGNMRYRVSAEPAIVLLGAVGIDALWARWRPRREATRVAAAAASGSVRAAGPPATIDAFPVVPAGERPAVVRARRLADRITGRAAAAPRPRSLHPPTARRQPAAPEGFTGRGTPMPHLPALDGLRGVAVILVLLFHGGFAWAKGGFLGVSTFFTLSGFLITNLLVRERDRSGRIDLGAFWSRRFRRLMPASLAALGGIALYGWALATPEQLQKLRFDLLGALAYVANWRFYFAGTSYGALFSAPSPVQHFWSLAIEEQFYVLFPLVTFLVLRHGGRRAYTGVLLAAAAASLACTYALRTNGDLVYYGTHTRAFELLAGALLAVWWSGRRAESPATRALVAPAGRALLAVAGVAAFAGTLWAAHHYTDASPRLARGGLALHAVAVCAVILSITVPGPLARVLALRPLRAVGLVSYGLYLYHWPIFLTLDAKRTGLSTTPLFVLRMLATTAVALLSYSLLEQPVRRVWRLRDRRTVALATPLALIAVVAASLAVTHDPPPSTIAYANARIGDIKPEVDVAEPATPGSTPAPGANVARTVMIVGDSGTVDASPAIGAAFKAAGATTIVNAAGPGFGLSNPKFTWRDDWRGLVAQYRPDLVLVMLGGWDIDYLKANGDAAYRRILDEAVGVLTSSGSKLLWLSMLPGGTTPDRPPDRLYEQLPAAYPGVVAYHDVEASLRGPDGNWPRAVRLADGSVSLWRKPDNWHLCPDGAARLADDIVRAAAAQRLAEVPTGAWQDGEWRSAALYDDPPKGCDVARYLATGK